MINYNQPNNTVLELNNFATKTQTTTRSSFKGKIVSVIKKISPYIVSVIGSSTLGVFFSYMVADVSSNQLPDRLGIDRFKDVEESKAIIRYSYEEIFYVSTRITVLVSLSSAMFYSLAKSCLEAHK